MWRQFDPRVLSPLSSPFGALTAPPLTPTLSHMDLHIPPELEARLNRIAAETGRNADQVALELLGGSVEHDEWFRREVETGRTAAREGRVLDHSEVASRIEQRYREAKDAAK